MLAERKIVAAVHRECEHARVAGKDFSGAVALVHVEVDDQHARRQRLRLHRARRDRGVVEDAEPFAVPAMRVMGAAGEIDAATGCERAAAGGERCTGGTPRALDHGRRPRKADAFLRAPVERPAADGGDVGRVVRTRKLRIRGSRRETQPVAGDRGHALAQRRVLAHRKPMAGRQRQYVVVGVVDQHSVDSSQLTVGSRIAALWWPVARHRGAATAGVLWQFRPTLRMVNSTDTIVDRRPRGAKIARKAQQQLSTVNCQLTPDS